MEPVPGDLIKQGEACPYYRLLNMKIEEVKAGYARLTMNLEEKPVSYTHLTLPTNREV